MTKGTSNFMGMGQVTSHSTKFGGHRQFGIGNIMVLFCHVISQDHVIKGHVTLWMRAAYGKSPSSKFGGYRHRGGEI